MEFLTLFISLRCTNKCAHCLYGCSPEHGEHMSWDIFQRSLTVAKENRIGRLNFFGGEPLLNPLFFPMLQAALEEDFSLIIATNCRLLAKKSLFNKFLKITNRYKKKIVIVTARDRFHLEFFDPAEIIDILREKDYEVVVNNYSDSTIALSEYNIGNQGLEQLNTRFSCCNAKPNDYLGILPDGGWTICPASIEAFGDIRANSLPEIILFKQNLPLRYGDGCTRCLKDFKSFHKYLK